MSKDIYMNKFNIDDEDFQLRKILKDNDDMKVPEEISTGIKSVL